MGYIDFEPCDMRVIVKALISLISYMYCPLVACSLFHEPLGDVNGCFT